MSTSTISEFCKNNIPKKQLVLRFCKQYISKMHNFQEINFVLSMPAALLLSKNVFCHKWSSISKIYQTGLCI